MQRYIENERNYNNSEYKREQASMYWQKTFHSQHLEATFVDE